MTASMTGGAAGAGARHSARLSAQRLYALVLAGRKELPSLLRAHSWDPGGKDRGRLLHGARVVIVGGSADGSADGTALMALLAPTGALVAHVVGAEQEVATAEADVLVLLPGAAPLGAVQLAALPEGAVLIDASAPGDARARAVDADVLAAGLAAGRPLHAVVLVGDDGPHVLSSSPRALVVPVGSGA